MKRIFSVFLLLLLTVSLAVPALADEEIEITKPPYGEEIYAGMGATFIARADNYTAITWKLISPDGTETLDLNRLGNRFPSLGITGADSEVLVLSRIPLEMDGWKVACLFSNASSEALTDTAEIKVFENAETITITQQPVGAVISPEEEGNAVLSTAAMCYESQDFVYQWFCASADSYTAMHAISGANESTYIVPREVGTKYYCATVALRTNYGSTDPTYTAIVAVTYKPEEHVHVYSDAWTSNDVSHWHQCTCGGHSDEAFHSYEWTVLTQPTDEQDGSQQGVCSVCGHETVQPIPAGSQESEAPAPQKDNTVWLFVGLALVAGAVIAAAVILILKVVRSEEK